MNRAALISLCVAICITLGCASERQTASTPTHPAQSKSAPTIRPILYHRTGGIAGTDDRVVIWPDGVVDVNGKLLSSARGHVAADRLNRLVSRFRGWDTLNDTYLAEVNDAYTLTISYGDKTITALDLAPNLPEQFRQIFTEIESIAAQAEAAENKPVTDQ